MLNTTARKLAHPNQYRAALAALNVQEAHADALYQASEAETAANRAFNHNPTPAAQRKADKHAARHARTHNAFCDALIESVDLDALFWASETAHREAKRLRCDDWRALATTLKMLWCRARNRQDALDEAS